MNARQRYINVLTYQQADRIPFTPGGPRESTRRRWLNEGLTVEADWQKEAMQAVGVPPEALTPMVLLDLDLRMVPQFEEKVLEHRDGHYIVQDWKGNVCEISDQFDVSYLRRAKDFVTRRWIRCPVETRQDWEQMKSRYDPGDPHRWPDTFPATVQKARSGTGVSVIQVSGPFWQMREWCGFEGLCFMMVEQPDLVAEMAEFWRRFVSAMFEQLFERVVPDIVFMCEDMAYKQKAMISPAMSRRFCMPGWKTWSDQSRRVGVPIIAMDSDGFVGELIPLWIESGINVCDPMEVAAGNDLNAFRRTFGRQIAYRCGIDKRAMAKGGKALSDEMARLQPVWMGAGTSPAATTACPATCPGPTFWNTAGCWRR